MPRIPRDDRRLNAPADSSGGIPLPPKPPSVPKPPKPPAPPKPPTGPAAGAGKKEPSTAAKSAFGGLRVSLMPVDEAAGKPDLRKRALVLLIVLVVETLLLGGGSFLLHRRAQQQEAEKARLSQERATLTARIREQEATAAELATFSKQVGVITPLLDRHAYWTNLFTLLEQYTKGTVRYDNFSAAVSSRTIALSAIAASYRDLAEQILVLRSAPMVAGVRVTSAVSDIDDAGNLRGVKATLLVDVTEELWNGASADKVLNAAATELNAVTPVVEREEETLTDETGRPLAEPEPTEGDALRDALRF